jgi:hypothetical protein
VCGGAFVRFHSFFRCLQLILAEALDLKGEKFVSMLSVACRHRCKGEEKGKRVRSNMAHLNELLIMQKAITEITPLLKRSRKRAWVAISKATHLNF